MKQILKNRLLIFIGLFAIYGIIQILLSTSILNDYYEINIVLMGINIILAVSLNLINGFTGQFSLGHAGFMSIGAYTSAIITYKLGLPFPLAILVGGIAAGIAGILIGIPSLRLKGDYLAITTLGFGEIIRVIFLNTEYVGGASGLSGIPKYTNWTWVFWMAVITIVLIRNFINSSYGRCCVAIREDETAAESMGINTTFYKTLAFTIGAFFAGIGGALYAHNFYIIQPETFNFMKSFDILTMVVLGGLGSITGSILSAIFLTFVYAALQDYAALRMVIYSLLLIVVMLFRPEGLMGTKEFSLKKLFKKGEKSNEFTLN
ncbi:branched-chain amino acid ABC transporter permease [Thermoanaerobacterium thermosaccharolyticum]|uniref:branched-chain amino acid ABC transporter permease n=1 Tax=Thermoanaerobacterium thermosaccharolyticum TaxID=1517 RepID=UPI0012399379|nr:branched-chain amino acid ABC transporter permease [Thermoanaerobacterium thermosaccharolyticum]KAA5808134.1 branched-chain amino acid ABC transporter permease [Thermoanaerobacterium thermosaccharolyticum]